MLEKTTFREIPMAASSVLPPPKKMEISVCVIGGQQITRMAIQQFLQSKGFDVPRLFQDENAMDFIATGQSLPVNVAVLILSGTCRETPEIRKAIERPGSPPLVILSDQVSRSQVYASLRLGAKAFVNLNADPGELVNGITMALQGKVYLSPEAAELLVSDVSGAIKPSQSTRLPNMNLSKREIEIVQLLWEGLSSKEIASNLHLSSKTVENHRYNIYRKCEVDSIACLIRHAIQNGMIAI